jgi:protein-arginine kinase activator protein McsA
VQQCERCQRNPARVRVDQMVDGKRESHYLCQSCVDVLMHAMSQAGSQGPDLGNVVQPPQTMDEHLNALDEKLRQLQATNEEQIALLTQILARLPGSPSTNE